MDTQESTSPAYVVSVIIAILLGMILGGMLALCLSILIWYGV
jgi:hypothetical protein